MSNIEYAINVSHSLPSSEKEKFLTGLANDKRVLFLKAYKTYMEKPFQ